MPRKDKIQGMFDSIAPEYDRLNHIMSLNIDKRWRRKALKRIFDRTEAENAATAVGESENCGMRILDVACGTGDFTIAIAERIRRYTAGMKEEDFWPGHVTGVDISEGMLKVMAGKVQERGLENLVSHEIGDCTRLRFEDGVFDRVTVAFGVRNFENLEAGLKEMLRVLKPGGRLVLLELSVPSNAALRWLFNLYFLHIMPKIGGKVSGDDAAYRYLPASVLKFPGKKEFMRILRGCGYGHVTHTAFSLGICRMYTGEKQMQDSRR